jgi:NADPH:quinone reductase-like Zn-dependent oxidoreductase
VDTAGLGPEAALPQDDRTRELAIARPEDPALVHLAVEAHPAQTNRGPPMKAVRFHEYGDPDVLRYEDVEQPVPGAGEVRLRVAATSFNPVDGGIRGGYLQGPFPVALPHTPGIDVAGTVDALGDGVQSVGVGDAVVAFLSMTADGAAAEYVITPADVLAPAPTGIPLADAAAFPMVGLTAWQALFDDAELEAGQRVLINGAGGAVGGYAVQLAKRAGAHVIATASPRSSERVSSAGADEVIDHTTTTVREAVAEPVDVLLNLARIAPEELEALVALVKPGGVVVNTIPTIPTPSDEARDVRAVGVFVRSDAQQLSQLTALVDSGELRVDVAQRVPLAELPAVHTMGDAGEVSGKVVVVVENN